MRHQLTPKKVALICLGLVVVIGLGILYVVGASSLKRFPQAKPTAQTPPPASQTSDAKGLNPAPTLDTHQVASATSSAAATQPSTSPAAVRAETDTKQAAIKTTTELPVSKTGTKISGNQSDDGLVTKAKNFLNRLL